jgi:hypothetical protein
MSLSADVRTLSNRPAIRCLALVILLTASTHFEPLSSAVLDPDLGWHLRGGSAIVAQHALPDHGVFTRHVERPWVEYSWGSELIASLFYRWFGLMGLVALRSSLEVLITAILFVTFREGLGSFWLAWPLTGLGMWAIHHCLGLQPMLASVALFALELALIFMARRRRTVRLLYAFPLLFLVWANLHIQFVYGIVVLMLLAGTCVAQRILPQGWLGNSQAEQELPVGPVLVIAGLSTVATIIGPNSWRVYSVLYDYVTSSLPYAVITELKALSFRVPEHFVLVLILGAAFFTLGWRRSHDPFQIALLIVSTVIGLRMMRDSWLVGLPALAIIANREGVSSPEPVGNRLNRFAFIGATAVATVLMFVVIAWDSKTDNASLEGLVAAVYPVRACEFVRTQALPGPLYNDMNWGGFLIWALPDKPVAIDNRTDLYGDELLSRFYVVQQGWADYKSDPDLSSARLVLLNRTVPLAAQLARDEHFHLAYQDPISVVFTHDPADSSAGWNGPAPQPDEAPSR